MSGSFPRLDLVKSTKVTFSHCTHSRRTVAELQMREQICASSAILNFLRDRPAAPLSTCSFRVRQCPAEQVLKGAGASAGLMVFALRFLPAQRQCDSFSGNFL